MDSLRYPDNGELLEDASILRNAVRFATEQRSSVGWRILNRLTNPTDSPTPGVLASLAVDAFAAEMTSTEDLLGWLFVLKEWKPGNPEKSLVFLLDRVQVGKRPHTEAAAQRLLDSLDAPSFRELVHVPKDDELEAAGFPKNVRDRLNSSIPANLDGMKRLVELRQRENRGYVVAFNKLKHLMLAIRTDTRGKEEVLVPGRFSFDEENNRISIQTAWISSEPQNVRVMASRAVIAQAVLNSILGVILWIRYGETSGNPPWAVAALRLPGWVEDEPGDAADYPEPS